MRVRRLADRLRPRRCTRIASRHVDLRPVRLSWAAEASPPQELRINDSGQPARRAGEIFSILHSASSGHNAQKSAKNAPSGQQEAELPGRAGTPGGLRKSGLVRCQTLYLGVSEPSPLASGARESCAGHPASDAAAPAPQVATSATAPALAVLSPEPTRRGDFRPTVRGGVSSSPSGASHELALLQLLLDADDEDELPAGSTALVRPTSNSGVESIDPAIERAFAYFPRLRGLG